MQVSKQELIDQVQDLVSLPEVYLKVRGLLNDPKSSIDDFASAVSFDPALTAKILKIANSAFFGFATKIDNISRAISIMGTAQLHDLVLASSAINAFNKLPENIHDIKQFWEKSIYSGVIAQLIGSRCNSLDSERYFVIGLLHNIGHLVLCSQVSDQMNVIFNRSKEEQKPLFQLERELFGFDYSEIGAELLQSWKLPGSFIEPTLYHLDPNRSVNFPLETSAIHIANILSLKKIEEQEKINHKFNIADVAITNTGFNEEDINILSVEGDIHFGESMLLFM